MKTIFKYTLEILQNQEIHLPVGYRIIHVHEQNGLPCMWAEVDESADRQQNRFYIVGTGHVVPEGTEYIGTAHCSPFVWHIYK